MKLIKHIPNAITLSNLALGVLSIVCATRNELLWASTFIALATIPDFLDGLVARLLGVSSNVGKDLDSLADLVSFGVAPAIMIIKLSETYANGWVQYVAILIPVFGALRLAKFNNDERQTDVFYGLTTTATALWLSSWPFLIEFDQFLPEKVFVQPVLFVVIPIIASVLMVANIKLFSLKFANLSWTENKMRYGFLILCVGYLALFGFLGVSLIILTYLLLSVIRNFAA
ncbi:MAG: CDP-diacylglycerol--serine O-phosphatidyltransferase [Bacteroidia bacterium]|nr:CDP-diacylglycerol--serine O-phosphatidyltransferase [Bacteroidia bacterium]